MVNNLRVPLFLYKCRHMLNGAPPGDVPIAAFAKNAVEQAGSTEQTDVATVQRRNGPARGNIVVRQ
jgi:hypothetical protein